MRTVYLFAMVIVLIVVIAAFCHSMGHKNTSATAIRFCLLFAALSVVANIAISVSTSFTLSTIAYSTFYASVDWMLLLLLDFVFLFVGKKPKKFNMHRAVAVIFAILDTLNIFMNYWLSHAFHLDTIVYDETDFIYAKSFELPYYVHLVYCYILALLVIVLLVRKIMKTQRFYMRKYWLVLASFLVVLVLDGLSLLLHSPLNIGVAFYGFLTAFICFYSLSFVPEGLINNTIKLAVETMESGIICFDVEGKFAYANSFVWKIFKVDPSAQLAENVYQDRKNRYRLEQLDSFNWSENAEYGGKQTYLECEYRKMFDNSKNFVGSYFHIMDVTNRIEAYEEQIRKAEAESKAKSDFVSKISHEIRTPINSVYGMDEMILRECKDPQILEYAQDIKNSAEVMICIVNDVLDFSKIESGKMELICSDYDALSVIRNLQHMIQVRTKSKGLDFKLDIDPNLPTTLHGDSVRLEQVIINLLTNAAKYTNEGEVRFKVSCVNIAGFCRMTFEVSDTGIGIKEEDIPKLCDAFERVEEMKNHSIQGTGLGLNIVAQLLKIMDSELIVESVYGKGSTFRFTVDQKIVNPAPGIVKEEKEQKIKKYVASINAPDKKILVVDDNMINRKVIRGLLKQTAINISEAASGMECLELVSKEYFDLIFLDHMMPELDGVETFKRMKNMEDYPCKNTPVIMLTANAIDGAKESYLTLGFNDFLAKPVIPMELEDLIVKYMNLEGENHE